MRYYEFVGLILIWVWRKKNEGRKGRVGLFFMWVWRCFLFGFRERVWRRKNDWSREGRTKEGQGEHEKGRTRKKLECLKLEFHVDFKSTLALPTHRT